MESLWDPPWEPLCPPIEPLELALGLLRDPPLAPLEPDEPPAGMEAPPIEPDAPPELERDDELEPEDPEEPEEPEEPEDEDEPELEEGMPPEEEDDEDEDCWSTQPPTRNTETAPTSAVCTASVSSRFFA